MVNALLVSAVKRSARNIAERIENAAPDEQVIRNIINHEQQIREMTLTLERAKRENSELISTLIFP